jgi:hypothetical protein
MAESNVYVADRSEWESGPWDREDDDKVVWVDQETDLDCMMKRNGSGAWCGYVGLPPEHPHHGVPYNDLYEDTDYHSVHGGLTYSDSCSGGICHVPEEGRPAHVWWLGFDCSHYCDLAPKSYGWGGGTYRTQEYVKKEVERLAKMVASFQ